MKNRIIIKKKKDLFFIYYDNVYSFFNVKETNVMYRLFIKLKLPLYIFFGRWKKAIKKCDEVIIFDNGYNKQITKYIKKKNKKIKIIFWYWNAIFEYNNNNFALDDKNIDEIWTYNRFDAEKYRIKLNTQFYSNKIRISNAIKQDIIFMGRNKNRKDELKKLQELFKELNISSKFIIVDKGDKTIPYKTYLKLIGESKCILDYSQLEFNGLSLRPLEAIFLRKKIITNNKDIKNYDFYKKENIFILGIDDTRDLYSFINSDYCELDEKIINKYDYNNWLSRF